MGLELISGFSILIGCVPFLFLQFNRDKQKEELQTQRVEIDSQFTEYMSLLKVSPTATSLSLLIFSLTYSVLLFNTLILQSHHLSSEIHFTQNINI